MKKFILFSILLLNLAIIPSFVLAATCPPGTKEGTVCLDNPLGKKITTTEIIGTIIKGALTVIGSLTLLMLVWGGFQWLTSAGNTEKVSQGTNTMIWAVIGVVIVFASYLMVETLLRVLSTGK